MRILVAATAITALGGCRCRDDPPRAGSPNLASAETDALWALAPASSGS